MVFGSAMPKYQGRIRVLVLSRHRDESIIVNGNVGITVVDIRGDKCRLGIEAPKGMYIHRDEVLRAINREGEKIYPMPCLSLPKQVYEHVERMAADRNLSMDAMLSQWITSSVENMMAQAG